MIRQVEVKDTKWLCSDGTAFYSKSQAELHEAHHLVKQSFSIMGISADKCNVAAHTINSVILRAKEIRLTKARLLKIIDELWVE